MITSAVAYLLFYPTLLWNNILAYFLPHRRWWNAVDDTLILGALPSKKHVSVLHRMGVRAVLNMCAETAGPTDSYEELGIAWLRLPTIDFTSPNLQQIQDGLTFIADQANHGHKTYVHCKAGRGRSATIALCWLIAKYGMAPKQAQARLLERRPHVKRRLSEHPVVREFIAAHKLPQQYH